MTATIMNHRVSMSVTLHFRLRSALDLTTNQEQEENSEHQVHAHESEKSEQAITGRHGLRITIGRAHERVDEPGLASQFGGYPAGSVRDVRERQRKQENPQHPARRKQLALLQEESCNKRDRDEQRSQSHHDVIAVIEQLDICRPLIFGEGV